MSGLLVLRADAGPGIGSGHAMRMIALGEAWVSADGNAVMMTSTLPNWLEEQADHRRVHVDRIDAERGSQDDARVSQAAAADAEWVVLDGYEFGPDFQHHFDPDRLLIVDDHLSLGDYRAAWVLDQNLGAEKLLAKYRAAAHGAALLLGSRYALLRREFAAVERPPTPEQARHVLVTLGGAPPVEARALVDAAVERLQSSGFTVDELSGSDDDVASRMARAELAVSAAGTTAWELCASATPSILLPIVSNQVPVARALHDASAALDLGWYAEIGPDDLVDAVRRLGEDRHRRERMEDRARVVIDGVGAERVVRILRGSRVRLREAKPDDAALLWRWANDPPTRAASFTPDPIPWESHVAWFERRLSDSDSVIYIAEDPGGAPVGQVRFDTVATPSRHIEIDVSVDPERRGRGYGVSILRTAVPMAAAKLDVSEVEAVVKSSNPASLEAFRQAGFETVGNEEIAEHQVLRLRWLAP